MKTIIEPQRNRTVLYIYLLALAGWLAAPLNLYSAPPFRGVYLPPPASQFGTTYDVAVADLNGDSKADVVFPEAEQNIVVVYYGDGAGGFSPPRTFPAGSFPEAVVVGDFNGDGKPDLAVGDTGSPTGVEILLNDGSGGFGSPTLLSTGGFPAQIVVADFNQDGNLDLAVSDFDSGNVLVFLGNGSGGFGAPIASPGGGGAIAIGDFNGDGILDLAAVNSNSDLTILQGNGAGGFSVVNSYPQPGSPVSLVAADFNHDNRLDLAVGIINTPYYVEIYIGDGSGGFTANGTVPINDAAGLKAADLDGDGNIDLAAATYSNNAVSVAKGDGAGNFGAPKSFSFLVRKQPLPINLTVGDLDGDGKPDLVTANYGIGGAMVLLNQIVH